MILKREVLRKHYQNRQIRGDRRGDGRLSQKAINLGRHIKGAHQGRGRQHFREEGVSLRS